MPMLPATPEEIAAARAYEELHVPALFRQWAQPVLDAAGVASADRVLDVACGTGVLARAAAARAGVDGNVFGVDPAPGMLAVAADLEPGVHWEQAPAENLPFEDGGFQAVVSQFGLMFFVDRPGALREMRRVLAPDGRVAVAVWGSLADSEAYPIVVELLQRMAGQAAADALRAPFALGDEGGLAALFQEAGLPDPEIATHRGTARFPSIRVMVEADLRGWLPVMGVHLREDVIQDVLDAAEADLREFRTGSGSVEFEVPALIAAWRSGRG